jgi:hypothetical protein
LANAGSSLQIVAFKPHPAGVRNRDGAGSVQQSFSSQCFWVIWQQGNFKGVESFPPPGRPPSSLIRSCTKKQQIDHRLADVTGRPKRP